MRFTPILIRLAAVFAFACDSAPALAHGGGLDANGCHTNRKTGEYHCHREPSSPAASASRSAQTPRVTLVSAASTTPSQDLTQAARVLLRALGYQPSMLGAIDDRTRAAVRSFQRAERLAENGVVTEALVLRLAERVAAKCP